MFIYDDTEKLTKDPIRIESVENAIGDYLFVRLEKNKFVDYGMINIRTRKFISDKVDFFYAGEIEAWAKIPKRKNNDCY